MEGQFRRVGAGDRRASRCEATLVSRSGGSRRRGPERVPAACAGRFKRGRRGVARRVLLESLADGTCALVAGAGFAASVLRWLCARSRGAGERGGLGESNGRPDPGSGCPPAGADQVLVRRLPFWQQRCRDRGKGWSQRSGDSQALDAAALALRENQVGRRIPGLSTHKAAVTCIYADGGARFGIAAPSPKPQA